MTITPFHSARADIKGNLLAKPNYQFEKRQRDLAKKNKQEEKRRQKLAGKAPADDDGGNVASDPAEGPSSDAGGAAGPAPADETKPDA